MKVLKLLLLLLVSQLTLAQVPTLSIHRQTGEESLDISQLDVNVEIVGNIATTTFDIVFYNPFNRVLEGELSMLLKNGQEICRYALDVNGKLREGVIVEKIKARQTYEAVVRRKIDPGIINKTKGNSFKTKIYPIPAKGSKRVVLALSETLSGDNENLYYILPFGGANKIKQFSLNVKAIKSQEKLNKPHSTFQNVEFDNQDNAYVLNLERENFKASEPIKFTIPRFSKDKHQLFTCDFEGKTYFYLNLKPEELKIINKQSPTSISIFWDNSFSQSKRNIVKELELLELYLHTLSANTAVSIIAFNIDATLQKNFIASDIKSIISYIKTLENDGATCLDCLNFSTNTDEILLFSDGVNTVGKDEILRIKVPVYTITSSAGSNYSFLKQVSSKTNGDFIDLSVITKERALELLSSDEDKFLSCKYNSSLIKEVYPKMPMRVDDYFELVGILIKENAELTINFGNKSGISQSKTFTIQKQSNTPVVARIWATKKIAHLDYNYKENKEDIFSLSQKYNIISKNTAMLVLDMVEDYVAHKITPPEELKDEYNRLIALKKEQEQVKLSSKEIQEININRIERLKKWYKNPIVEKPNIDHRVGVNERIIDSEEGASIPLPLREGASIPVPPEEDIEILDEIAIEEDEIEAEMMVMYAIDDSGNDIERKEESLSKSKSSIKVLSWMPDAPYIKTLRSASDNDLLPLYYKLKDENLNRPSFYIQVADLFFKKEKYSEAVRILSNALELDLENPELLKIVARRLLDENEYNLAINIFIEIKNLRPEEPQSYRDLAMAYCANKQYQKALDMYLHILDNKWLRFEEIKDVVFNELNRLIALHSKDLDLSKVNKDYINSMPLDVRITIDWSSNENDIDLWVIDPNGEKCYYKNKRTKMGGKITKDFTRGYGPEEFTLKTAKRGFYSIYVNYYSESRQTITGPVTVYATLTTNYGTKDEKTEKISIQLENDNEKKTLQIGQLEFIE
jgi:hypothetical protein